MFPHLPPNRGCYNRGCRCEGCCAANYAYEVAWRRSKGIAPQKVWRHRTTCGYTDHGCRCDECKAANARAHARWRDNAKGRTDRVFAHGGSGYRNHGCRCEVCTSAQREISEKERKSRRLRMLAGDPSVPHGTKSGYQSWYCRCDACRSAMGIRLVTV
jgi:hypothetical protein